MRSIALVLLLAAAWPVGAAGACELCGRWRSDAARTLPEMEKSVRLTEKQRLLFRNDFFGKLVEETREKYLRAYFPDQSPESVAWEPWQVVSRKGAVFQVSHLVAGELVQREVRLDGNCYRVLIPELGFGEWFCRVPDAE